MPAQIQVKPLPESTRPGRWPSEKVTDFGFRAIHLMTAVAKEAIHARYGTTRAFPIPRLSNGGRQALMEAQRFPADYDGISRERPANYCLISHQVVFGICRCHARRCSYNPREQASAIAQASTPPVTAGRVSDEY